MAMGRRTSGVEDGHIIKTTLPLIDVSLSGDLLYFRHDIKIPYIYVHNIKCPITSPMHEHSEIKVVQNRLSHAEGSQIAY